ncbi:MAG: hypothetical protein JW841_04170 [Deltaproteobacteria bacterium]|nr:hypothetical protein [Deltaproteobacteria bacterium]
MSPYDLEETKLDGLLQWESGDGYLGYSLKAIQKLLPYLYEGKNEYEAILCAYPNRGVSDRFNVLPALLSKALPPELKDGEKAVMSCRGGLTAELRRQLALNDILPPLINADGKIIVSGKQDDDGNPLKSRDDHRHHAIDAVVIALSSRAFLKRYQDYWKTRDTKNTKPTFMEPWPKFADDVKMVTSQINVSHRVCKKINGALHQETFYGPVKDNKGKLVVGKCAFRKPLEKMEKGEPLEEIIDLGIRELAKERAKACGWDGDPKSPLPKGAFDIDKPLLQKSGVSVKKARVQVSMNNPHKLKHRYAKLGNNHHMVFVAQGDSAKGTLQTKVVTVPMIEAIARIHKGDNRYAPVNRQDENGTFLMSLCRKESLLATNPVTGEETLCVVQKFAQDFDVCIRDARDSREATLAAKTPFKRVSSIKSWEQLDVRKVQVDPLGRVSKAND